MGVRKIPWSSWLSNSSSYLHEGVMVRLTILGGYGEISTIREVFMVRLTMNKNLELFRTTEVGFAWDSCHGDL